MLDIYGMTLRDKSGHVAKGGKAKESLINETWRQYDAIRTDFALSRTRLNYSRVLWAAAAVLAFQEREGVWLIHPANAGPGLKADDPRIAD
jgi:hypothetical protein